MGIEDIFKKTKFVDEYIDNYGQDKAFTKQLSIVAGELFEAQEAYAKNDYIHTKEEIIDVIHSAVQLLYLTPNYKNGEAEEIIKYVIDKNEKRNYYTK